MTDHTAFWEEQHRDRIQLYLTDSPLAHYRSHAGVSRLPWTRNLLVMEIGVGYGTFVRQLQTWGHQVIAVDLSGTALVRLPDPVWRVRTPDMVGLPSHAVDYAICHLVLQHCDNAMVEFLFRETARVLKSGALASFQFATRLPGPMPEWLREGEHRGVLYWRTPEVVHLLAAQAGISVLHMSDLALFSDQKAVGWYFASFVKE